MEKKKKIALAIPHCILMAAALVLNCYALASFEASALIKGVIVLSVVALLAGFAYILLGYTKKAAGLYKIFMALYMILCVLSLIEVARYDVFTFLPLVIRIAIFAVLVILTAWANVGKKGSYLLCALLVLCQLVLVLWSAFVLPNILPAEQQAIFFGSLGEFVLSTTAGFMVMAKYADKTARGTN